LVTGIVVNFGRISTNPAISASSSFKSTWEFRSLFVRESTLLEMTHMVLLFRGLHDWSSRGRGPVAATVFDKGGVDVNSEMALMKLDLLKLSNEKKIH
jgi:hypothetical protein